MTISQTLRKINKLKGQLRTHLDRAQVSVTHRIDQPPAWAFGDSLREADKTVEELVQLETALRIANATTRVVGLNMTLAEATCRLAEMKSCIAWLAALSVRAQHETKEHAGYVPNPQSPTQMQAVTAIVNCYMPEAKRAEAVEKMQAEFDALNDAVETTNHRTEINL